MTNGFARLTPKTTKMTRVTPVDNSVETVDFSLKPRQKSTQIPFLSTKLILQAKLQKY